MPRARGTTDTTTTTGPTHGTDRELEQSLDFQRTIISGGQNLSVSARTRAILQACTYWGGNQVSELHTALGALMAGEAPKTRAAGRG